MRAGIAHSSVMLKILAMFVVLCLPVSAIAGLVGPVRVIDADTWDVGGERVRLFGIDAPEVAQSCRDGAGKPWACGVWTAAQVRERYENRVVACERLDTDRYGRTVARCFDDGADVARDMVARGLAFAYRRYSQDYVLDEKAAVIKAVGLHSGTVQAPAEYRAEYRAELRQAGLGSANGACRIKGNISSSGERIFHLPEQRYYDRTRISRQKGERWFCSESAALASGWRRALR